MTDSPRSRRHFLRSGVAAGTLLFAGCGTDSDTDGTETATGTGTAGETTTTAGPTTPTTRPTAAIGEVVGDDSLSMVLLGASQRQSIAGRTAEDGNTMVVAFFEMKNGATEQFLSMEDVEAFHLADGSDDYRRVVVSEEPGNQFRNGLLAPGEVVQGYLAFETPATLTEPAVEVDIDSDHTTLERATFRLDQSADSVTRLEQTLHVPAADIGESVTEGSLTVTVTDFRTADAVDGIQSGEETTFAIPTVRIENDADEAQMVFLRGQALLKSDTGEVYATSTETQPALDEALPWNTEVPANGQVEGEVPYNAGADTSPLYFVFDFSGINDGDRYVWQVA